MKIDGYEKCLLNDTHFEIIKNFDCSLFNANNFNEMNVFLKENAIEYNKKNFSRTYIYICNNECAAYYSLAMGAIKKPSDNKLKEEYKPLQDIPSIHLIRLAVDKKYRGIGSKILKNIIEESYSNKEIASRCIFLEAYPESVWWYLDKTSLFEINYKTLNESLEEYCEKYIICKLNTNLTNDTKVEFKSPSIIKIDKIDVNQIKNDNYNILYKHIINIFNELTPNNSLLKECDVKVKLTFEKNKIKINIDGFNTGKNRDLIRNWLKERKNILNIDIPIPIYADINKIHEMFLENKKIL